MRIRDTGWKILGSGMEKFRIRDKHSRSTTQLMALSWIFGFVQGVLQRDGRDVVDEAAGVREDVRPGVPGREGVHLQASSQQ